MFEMIMRILLQRYKLQNIQQCMDNHDFLAQHLDPSLSSSAPQHYMIDTFSKTYAMSYLNS